MENGTGILDKDYIKEFKKHAASIKKAKSFAVSVQDFDLAALLRTHENNYTRLTFANLKPKKK